MGRSRRRNSIQRVFLCSIYFATRPRRISFQRLLHIKKQLYWQILLGQRLSSGITSALAFLILVRTGKAKRLNVKVLTEGSKEKTQGEKGRSMFRKAVTQARKSRLCGQEREREREREREKRRETEKEEARI